MEPLNTEGNTLPVQVLQLSLEVDVPLGSGLVQELG